MSESSEETPGPELIENTKPEPRRVVDLHRAQEDTLEPKGGQKAKASRCWGQDIPGETDEPEGNQTP